MPAPKGHEPYPGSETGGRPRKYTPDEINAFADELVEWLRIPTNIWFKDFCLDKNIDPDLMSEWADENEKFSGAYKLAKQRQESRLVNGGLLNAFNGSIVKLVLANAHGWVDRQETKISGSAANPLAFLLLKVDGTSKDLVNDGSDSQ
jgi:hypothetical protein